MIHTYQPFEMRSSTQNTGSKLDQESCDIVSYHYEDKDLIKQQKQIRDNESANVDNNTPRQRENSNNRNNIMKGMDFAQKMKTSNAKNNFDID